jgi:hypothetical protein
MDNAARTRQRVLAIFLPVTAVLYISAEALSPKGTDQVISTAATALKVLPIAARHPAQLYVAGSLALLGLGGLGVSCAAIAALVAQRSGLVVMGEQDPDYPDPRAEADWIARALRGQVVMVPEAGHYRSRSGPTSPPAQSCASWNRSRAVPRAGRRAAVLAALEATAWGYCP